METVTACLAGPAEIAGRLAKKGTESDFTLYNLKREDKVLVVAHGSRGPEKPTSLLFAAQLADVGVLVAEKLDAALGEAIVAFDLLQVPAGFVVLRGLLAEQLAPILAGTRLESWPVVDEKALQERLLAVPPRRADGPVRVPIDHFFPVKGVGTVVLGQVRRGTLHRHTELEVAPTGKRVQVRSIQLQDEEVEQAPTGARPGVALKGIETTDLDRGHVLCDPGSLRASATVTAKITPHRLFRGRPGAGGVGLNLFLGLQVRAAALQGEWPAPGATGEATLVADSPITYLPGDRGLLLDMGGKGLRYAAGVEIA